MLRPDTCPPNYAPGVIVYIESVDEFGFLGRDHHPDKSDVGKFARVEVVEYESDHRVLDQDEEDVAILTCAILDADGCNETGRVVELVSHEVLIESDPR